MAHLGNKNLNNEAQILIFSLYKMTNPISHFFLTIFLRKAKLFLLMYSSMCVCLGVCVHAHVCTQRPEGMSSIFLSLFSTLFIMVGSLTEPRAGCWLN